MFHIKLTISLNYIVIGNILFYSVLNCKISSIPVRFNCTSVE